MSAQDLQFPTSSDSYNIISNHTFSKHDFANETWFKLFVNQNKQQLTRNKKQNTNLFHLKNSSSMFDHSYDEQRKLKLDNLSKDKALKFESDYYESSNHNKNGRWLQQTPYINPMITQQSLQFAFCSGNNITGIQYCYTNQDNYNAKYSFNCQISQNDPAVQICIMQLGGGMFVNNTFYSQQGILIQWYSYQEQGYIYQCASNNQYDLQCVYLFDFNKTMYLNTSNYQCNLSSSSSNVSCYTSGNNPQKVWDWNCYYDDQTFSAACQSNNSSAYILLQTGISFNSSGNSSDINVFFTYVDYTKNVFKIQNLKKYNDRNSKWRVKTPQQKYCYLNQTSQSVYCYEIDGNFYQYDCDASNLTISCQGMFDNNSQGRQQTTYLSTGYMYNTDLNNNTIQVFYCNTNLSISVQVCTYLYSIQQNGQWTQNIIFSNDDFIDNVGTQISPNIEFKFCQKSGGQYECYTDIDDQNSLMYDCSYSQWNPKIVYCINNVENGTTTNNTYFLKQNILLQWNYDNDYAQVFQCQFDQNLNSLCKLMFSYNKDLSFTPQSQMNCYGDNKTNNYACYSYGYSAPNTYQCSFENVSNSLICTGAVNTLAQGFYCQIQIGTGISTCSFQNTTDVIKSFCDVNLLNNSFVCTQLYSYNERSLQQIKTAQQKSCVGNSTGALKCSEIDGRTYNYNCKSNNISNTLVCLDVNQTNIGGRNYTTYLNSGIQFGIDSSSNNSIQVHYCNTNLKNLSQNCTYLYIINYFGGMSSQLATYYQCDQNILGDLLCSGVTGTPSSGETCLTKKYSNVTVCQQNDGRFKYCMYIVQYRYGFILSCTNDIQSSNFTYSYFQVYPDINGYLGASYLQPGPPCQNVSLQQCQGSIQYNPNYRNRTPSNLTFYFTENSRQVRNSTNALLKIGYIGSYCLSQNGKTCFSDNGIQCDLSTGYNCFTDQNLNLVNVTYCYTNDSYICLRDQGSYCKDSNCYLPTYLSNNSQNCATVDRKNCYSNRTILMTQDYENITSPIKIFQETGYCVSNDQKSCFKTVGANCNFSSSYMCARIDGNLRYLSNCITLDNQTCMQDWGQVCNYTGIYNWCNIRQNNYQTCLIDPNDNNNCIFVQSGFYYTLNGYNTISQGQAQIQNGIYPTYPYYSSNQTSMPSIPTVSQQTQGSYCYSDDGLFCLQDYGEDCDQSNYSNCSTTDGINPIKVRYFYTLDGDKVYQDIGADLCNFNGAIDEIWCNLQVSSNDNYCQSYDGINCYNPQARFYITYDNQTVNQDPYALLSLFYGQQAQYCYSYDGYNCTYDRGENCDSETGIYCSDYLGQYCISLDNQTCYKDYGDYCNNTDNTWCMINSNINYCFSVDNANCFNFNQGFCYTLDLKNCTSQDFSLSTGSYCWSQDGITCTGQGLPTCYNGNETWWQLNGQNCGNDTSNSFCITQDGISCLQDNGYFCNNPYDFRWCNIDSQQVKTCLTSNLQTCTLSTLTSQPITAQNVAKRRQNFRNYFYYAINQDVTVDSSQVSTCQDCRQWTDSCCVQVNQTITDSTGSFNNANLDNYCMNKHVVHNVLTFQLDNTFYTLQCKVRNLNMNAIYIKSSIASLLASVLIFISLN